MPLLIRHCQYQEVNIYIINNYYCYVLSCFLEIENIQTTLISINNSVSNLQSSTNSLNNTLQVIAENVTALRTECDALPPETTVNCSALNASEISNGLNVDYNQVCLNL